jgi:hypothetical protein
MMMACKAKTCCINTETVVVFGWRYYASLSSYSKDVVSEIMACVGIEEEKLWFDWDKSKCAGSTHCVL